MNNWIRINYDFGTPMARLLIPIKNQDFREAIGNLADDPEALAQAIETFIRVLRPDLHGGTVFAMHADLASRCWEILYVHPSFARVPFLEKPPGVHLTSDIPEPLVVEIL